MQSRTKNAETEPLWATIVKRGAATSGYSSPSPSPSKSMVSGAEGLTRSPLNLMCQSSHSDISDNELNESPTNNTVSNGSHEGEMDETQCTTTMSILNTNHFSSAQNSMAKEQSIESNQESGPTVFGPNLEEYGAMLQKELYLRQWHNGNLSRTIARNRANYEYAEQKLRSMIMFHKTQYESSLEQLYPGDDDQQEFVHQEIRKMLESTPQKRSKSMEMVDRKLAAGRLQLKSIDSFYRWQREIEQFVTKIRGQTVLSAEELEAVSVFAARNAVEMEKVKENHLLMEMQKMAEHYHSTLIKLRMEVRWWQKRYQVLESHF